MKIRISYGIIKQRVVYKLKIIKNLINVNLSKSLFHLGDDYEKAGAV
ncbi:hypothetical protein ACSXAY_02130 [Clostridium perfringens]